MTSYLFGFFASASDSLVVEGLSFREDISPSVVLVNTDLDGDGVVDVAALAESLSVDRKLPALVVAEPEAFAPEFELAVVPDVLEQGLACGGAVVGCPAGLDVQFVEGCLCGAFVAKLVVRLGLDENHFRSPDES